MLLRKLIPEGTYSEPEEGVLLEEQASFAWFPVGCITHQAELSQRVKKRKYTSHF